MQPSCYHSISHGSSKMRRCFAHQGGAVLAEAAVAIPLFLAVLLGIGDLALSLSDRCAFLAAFHDATRKASIDLTACATQTQVEQTVGDRFQESLHSFLPMRISNLSASISTSNPLQPMLETTIRAPASCLFCLFFFSASGSLTEYSSTVTLPLEKRSQCS